jgi:hypothetical protein
MRTGPFRDVWVSPFLGRVKVPRLDLKLRTGAVQLLITAFAQSDESRDLCISEIRPIHTLPPGCDSLWGELQDHIKSQ